MERYDNPYNLFPKDKFYVKMVHKAPGMKLQHSRWNNPDEPVEHLTKKDCDNSKYLSTLEVRRKLPNGEVDWSGPVIFVTAKCSKMDTPSRKDARAVLRLKARAVAEAYGWL